MRIALFSDTYWPQVNGVAMTLKRLTAHLEHRNISFRIFVPRCSEEESYTDHVQRFTSLPFLLYPECRLALPNIASIHNQLQAFQPDLIHIATPFNIGLCGLYYARKYAIPHVASYHTHFDRYLSYYHLQFISPLLWRYIRWFHQSCHAIFVPSQETADQLAGQSLQGLKLWKRGVDCSLFHPLKRTHHIREKYGIKERFILLYVGRLAPEKDLDIMPELMRMLPDTLRDQVHWIYAGDGPLLKQLQESAPSNTTFTGYLKGEALAELYASADVLVFPSSTETFGNVVLEAFASGTPAIGAASGGVQEIIQHGHTGLLCRPRQAEAFAQAITGLLEHPETLHDWGMAGRAYAMAQSWEAIFDQLLVEYEQIVRSASARGESFSA